MTIMSTNINPSLEMLTKDQKEMLFFIYQGEKVARDIYITLGDIHKEENTFAFLQFSGQRHFECAKELCAIYGVEASQIEEARVGQFESVVLQTVYDACTEKGKKSIHDALEVAEFIKSNEIKDLEYASVGMPGHVVSVYENIKKRNQRHLDAFQSALSKAA